MAAKHKQVLIDSGPLLALFQRNNRHHKWVVSHLDACTEPMLTCESVVSETLFLMKREGVNTHALSEMLRRRLLQVPNPADLEGRVADILDKYADLPTSLADAVLLEMSERYPRIPLMTFDSDFLVYRRKNRTVIPVLIPKK